MVERTLQNPVDTQNSLLGLKNCDKPRISNTFDSYYDKYITQFKKAVKQSHLLDEVDDEFSVKALELASNPEYSKYVYKISSSCMTQDEHKDLKGHLNFKEVPDIYYSVFCLWDSLIQMIMDKTNDNKNPLKKFNHLIISEILSRLMSKKVPSAQIPSYEKLLVALSDALCTNMLYDYNNQKVDQYDILFMKKALNCTEQELESLSELSTELLSQSKKNLKDALENTGYTLENKMLELKREFLVISEELKVIERRLSHI